MNVVKERDGLGQRGPLQGGYQGELLWLRLLRIRPRSGRGENFMEFMGIHAHGMGGSWTFCRKRPAAGRRTSKTKKSRMFACCGVRHFPGITEERKSVPSFGPIRPNGYAQYKLRGYRCRPIEKRPSWNILLIVCIWAGSWGFIVAGGFAVSWQCAVRVRV